MGENMGRVSIHDTNRSTSATCYSLTGLWLVYMIHDLVPPPPPPLSLGGYIEHRTSPMSHISGQQHPGNLLHAAGKELATTMTYCCCPLVWTTEGRYIWIQVCDIYTCTIMQWCHPLDKSYSSYCYQYTPWHTNSPRHLIFNVIVSYQD